MNVEYDSLLPQHLNAEGLRALPVVHKRNVDMNSVAFFKLVKESETTAHNMNSESSIGQDSWSAKVDVRPPPEASAGKFDTDGSRAAAELEHFRQEHDTRQRSLFSDSELLQARNLIQQSLKAGRIRASAR